MSKAAATEAETQEYRDKQLRSAYTAATQTLRENHRDEFNALYGEEAALRGVEWSPRLSPEDKARQEIEELLAKYPTLPFQAVEEPDNEGATDE